MRHLMSPMDFSVEELDKLMDLANDIEKNPAKYSEMCKGKKLATCFYEPSTRTRLSFEAAMLNLGGQVLGFASADSSSAAKGESVSDTIRVVSCYADICAMRHPKEGAPLVASKRSRIPVINAGDGGHQHPTQTLTDLLTRYLRPSAEDMNDSEFSRISTLLTFYVVSEALSQIGNHDKVGMASASYIVDGTVKMSIGDIAGAGITAKDHILHTAHEMPNEYLSYMIFSDLQLASDLFSGKVNSVACVGHGKIKIGGMISQVDNMNRILDRVSMYLA